MVAMMTLTLKRSWFVIVVIVIAAAVLGHRQFATHEAPHGQPALVHLDAGSLETLHTDFNAARDSVRLIVLLSPT
ncbi:MAG: hypothetical protein ACJ731_04245 [Vicinamibacterales bacterium]